ncbi:glycosyl hydrolase [Photorhabdus temperata]|uniref:O-glycosyl hydrolase n=1 Tax=Photorhabdus temperata subsp. temperata Meg1 TaxID=1393735 RepID=A0A081RVB1_PHOTE|nr:glycoside hydrolase family 30 beta sandwich domain-containing protein [Photorhabdus temperata]KER02614.1 O-glycosyl hydrolase [Photorhabdus temperata subsp. temperata Meg1]MCT8348008.1 glycosyl hydrolase [Photorhabdus temperata]
MIKFIYTNDKEKWKEESSITRTNKKANLIITNKRGRKLDGFGGCFNELGMKALLDLDKENRKIVLDKLFSPDGECKFTLARMPIGASDYAVSWYSLNDIEDDYSMAYFSIQRDKSLLIPYIKEALNRQPNLKISASPWSPPVWLKTHQVYNFGKLKSDAQSQDAYALYFTKFVESYHKEGISIAQVHIQNEVAADQKFPSCVWSGEQLRDFIKEHLGPKFEKDNIKTEIWLGTINSPEFFKEVGQDYDNYANCVLRDEDAYRYVKGVGYQWQGKNAIQRTVQSYPELKYYQTENECGDGNNSWEYAHYVFTLFRHYLTNGANGYLYWNMVLHSGGESSWGWKQNSMISIPIGKNEVIYNPEYYVMRHFSGLILPDAKHIELEGHMSGNAVAFENKEGSIIVNINNSYQEKKLLNIKHNDDVWRVCLEPNSINSIIFL